MKNILKLFAIVSCLVFLSCSGSHTSKTKDIPVLENGKVIASVACLKNVSHTFALYLPSTYAAEKKYPLIICFDAHGSGYKPVELFREQAEKYGYIVAGSNVSKNGIPMEATNEHYNILLDDLLLRFNVDRLRIYTCGFSGGSRVASDIAINKGGIAGVIGCSAGFPQVRDGIRQKFDYFGYAGNEDMNYAEMVAHDIMLENSGFRHQLLVFNGTHDWPPREYIAESMIWTEMNAMRDGKKPIDKGFINEQLGVFDKELATLKKESKPYEEYLMVYKILNYFKGLTDVKKYEEMQKSLEKETMVQDAILKAKMDIGKERSLQEKYLEKLSTENIAWWKGEVKRLDNFIATTKDEAEKHLLKRILEYLSLTLYSSSSSAYARNDFMEAEHYIELYALIDPDNPEPEFMWAQVLARKKDIDKSLMHLKKSAELGFKEKARIDNDTIFLKLNNDKRFGEIMELVTENQNKKP